jgi:hypothetical protein
MPRDLGDRHSIGVTLAGWMAHAKDRKFQEVYVDRTVSRFGPAPLSQRAAQLLAGVSLGDLSWSQDGGGLVCALPNQAIGAASAADAVYQAPPGVTIAALGYRGKSISLPGSWTNTIIARDSGSDTYTPTLDDTLRTLSLTTARTSLDFEVYTNGAAATPAAGSSVAYSKLAVYGGHGLTLTTGDTSEPPGIILSDILTNVARRWCPLLDTSGVQANTYVVQHCAFWERTTPYDAFLELNKYALWHLGVWEGKRLDFRPYDLTDYDWEIRTDDPGTTFAPQGPSTDGLFNGIVVTYTDPLTGVAGTLTPDVYTDLADTSSDNPWNQHGIQHWDEIQLTAPALLDQALQLGRAALAERNSPKNPGTITVRGYIRDRAGNLKPVWKVRAGDTISVTNFPNDSPRLIVETDYDHESKTNSLAIDRPFATLDAYLDRQTNALQAAGLA